MSIVSEIKGTNGQTLEIGHDGTAQVVIHSHPPLTDSVVALPFRQFFTDDGTPTGSNDMIVDGSTVPVRFSIGGSPDEDRFIKFISVKLADAAAKLDKFGALTALTNGVSFAWDSNEKGELVIHDGLKDNLEFFRLSEQAPIITDLSGGGADSILVSWDLAKIFGSQWGIKLKKGTTERLSFIVNDALAGLVEFNAIGHGTKIT